MIQPLYEVDGTFTGFGVTVVDTKDVFSFSTVIGGVHTYAVSCHITRFEIFLGQIKDVA
jgi:hypothetical protein